MPRGATQDRRVMGERSDRMWSTGEENGKALQRSCLENPMNSMERQNDSILKEELPRSVSAQYATGDQWKKTPERMKGWSQSKNNTQLWMGLIEASPSVGDKSKVRCCKEQYCIGTWNARSMNQGKLKWSNGRWQE